MNLTPILQLFGSLVCMGRGHQRGKRVTDLGSSGMACAIGKIKIIIRCPRCGATWKRSVSKPKQEQAHGME